jgi:transposase
VEETFSRQLVISLKSTGHYSQRIIHFFLKQGFEVYHINPLVPILSRIQLKKVKTDQIDTLELVKLPFLHNFRSTPMPKDQIVNLKVHEQDAVS